MLLLSRCCFISLLSLPFFYALESLLTLLLDFCADRDEEGSLRLTHTLERALMLGYDYWDLLVVLHAQQLDEPARLPFQRLLQELYTDLSRLSCIPSLASIRNFVRYAEEQIHKRHTYAHAHARVFSCVFFVFCFLFGLIFH